MDNKNDGQIVFLKDLVFAALYRWRRALIWLIVFAVIIGGFKGISSFQNMKNSVLQSENSAQQELQMEVYETKKASLEQQIKINRENARQQQIYLNESVLMNLDPYSYYEIYFSIYVDSGYQIMPDKSHQNPDLTNAILHGYEEVVRSEDCVLDISEIMQTQTYYVNEIISVSTPEDANTFVISAKTPDLESADALLAYFRQFIENTKADVVATVAPHDIRVSETYVRKQMDSTLADLQQEQMDKLAALNNSLVNLQTEKNELMPPETLVADAGSVVKDAIIFAVIGGILGVFLVVLGAWITHISSGKVYSARTLVSRTGVKILGCVGMDRERGKVENWLRAKEGRNMAHGSAQRELIAVNVRNLCAGKKEILVVGSAENAEREEFVKALRKAMPGCTVSDSGNLLQSVDAMVKLAQAEAVIMVEQCGSAQYAQIQQQLDIIDNHHVQLIGCVLLDG